MYAKRRRRRDNGRRQSGYFAGGSHSKRGSSLTNAIPKDKRLLYNRIHDNFVDDSPPAMIAEADIRGRRVDDMRKNRGGRCDKNSHM